MSAALARVKPCAVALDRAVLTLAGTHLHTPRAERLIAAYSRLGEHGACWVLFGGTGALLDSRPTHRQRWLRGVRIVLAAYGSNYVVKVAVHRLRPKLPGLPPLTTTVSRLSFPSAHATTSFAAARAFTGLVPPTALYVPAIAFALTRPYLGVHYPSDVIAGALLGTAIAATWPAASAGASGEAPRAPAASAGASGEAARAPERPAAMEHDR